MRSGIYQIKCLPTGKIYIGSAANVAGRWSVHRHLLARGRHHSIHLQRSWDRRGCDAFEFTVVEWCAIEDLLRREQFYLDSCRPFGRNGFNIAPVAGSTRGAKRSPEAIERMAVRFRGKKLTAEHRAKIGAGLLGRKHSEETRAKISAARREVNGQRGRPLTECQKAALHKRGKEHPWFGRAHSEETKQRIAEAKSAPILQLDDAGEVVAIWKTAKAASDAMGLRNADTIRRAINSDYRKAGGWRWSRAP